MKRILIALIMALPSTLAAQETATLWCMPSKFCNWSGDCHANSDTELSMRLHDHTSKNPTLRVHAEDVPLVLTRSGEVFQWDGKNAAGEPEALVWRPGDGAFTYLRSAKDGATWKASGNCEVEQ